MACASAKSGASASPCLASLIARASRGASGRNEKRDCSVLPEVCVRQADVAGGEGGIKGDRPGEVLNRGFCLRSVERLQLQTPVGHRTQDVEARRLGRVRPAIAGFAAETTAGESMRSTGAMNR